jgi:predicted membrane channel-forming protein YqfA (hemolysin III family)
MAPSYRTRKRLSLLILAVGMPLYIVVAVTVLGLFDRPPLWLELLVYVALGMLWVLPFRAIFRGIGQADPNAPPDIGRGDDRHP